MFRMHSSTIALFALAVMPVALGARQGSIVSPIEDLVGCGEAGEPVFVVEMGAEGDGTSGGVEVDWREARSGRAAPPAAAAADYFYAGGEIVSSPKPIVLDGDTRPGIVFGNSNGQIYVLTADGVAAPGWPVIGGSMVGYCSPAVADLDGDGLEDIVVHGNNNLQAYAQNGTALPGWPQALDSGVSGNSMVGSPVIADIDDDGDLEVLVGHLYRMYAFHHDGTNCAGWPVYQSTAWGPLYSTPAVGDLDDDGDLEICFKIYGGNGDPANIHLMHHDGTALPGWPKLGLDRSHLSSPIIADVDGDGERDIIVSLHYYSGGNYVRVYVWRPDGTDVDGFPVSGSWNTAPENQSVGDVDDDGMLEIFVSTSNGTSPYYAVHAWNHDGTVLAGNWPRSAPYCLTNSSPALADVDGGLSEIMIGAGGCYVNDPGVVNVWDSAGTPLDGWPDTVDGFLRSSPLIMDADYDGSQELYIGTSLGWILRYEMQDEAKGTGAAEWNQIFGNPRNTNCYEAPAEDCPADVNADEVVNIDDVFAVLSAWGPCDSCPEDIDESGAVDIDDLFAVLAEWGPCP